VRDRFGRRLTPGRAGTITGPQRQYLARLIREAFSKLWTYHDVGCLDPNHLESMSQRDASAAIARLKAARDLGWVKPVDIVNANT
jgi:hypothetical protein